MRGQDQITLWWHPRSWRPRPCVSTPALPRVGNKGRDREQHKPMSCGPRQHPRSSCNWSGQKLEGWALQTDQVLRDKVMHASAFQIMGDRVSAAFLSLGVRRKCKRSSNKNDRALILRNSKKIREWLPLATKKIQVITIELSTPTRNPPNQPPANAPKTRDPPTQSPTRSTPTCGEDRLLHSRQGWSVSNPTHVNHLPLLEGPLLDLRHFHQLIL